MKYLLKHLLFCTVIMLFSFKLSAQLSQRVITVTKANMDIPALAKMIAAQTGVEYSLNMQNISLKKNVKLRLGKWKLEDVMKEVQEQAGLNYKVIGDHILFTDYKPESKVGDKVESKAENKAESKAENKVESKPESNVGSKAGNKAGNKVKSNVGYKPESKVENKEENKVKSNVGYKPESKMGNKVENKLESKVGYKPESKVGDKVGNKVGDKGENKVWNKVESKVGYKPESKVGEKVGDKVEKKDSAVVVEVKAKARDQVIGSGQKTGQKITSNIIRKKASNTFSYKVSNTSSNKALNTSSNKALNTSLNKAFVHKKNNPTISSKSSLIPGVSSYNLAPLRADLLLSQPVFSVKLEKENINSKISSNSQENSASKAMAFKTPISETITSASMAPAPIASKKANPKTTNSESTTVESITSEPTTSEPTNSERTNSKPTNSKATNSKATNSKTTTSKSLASKEKRHITFPESGSLPFAEIGLTANDIVYLSASAKAGIQYLYGIGTLGFTSRGLRFRYGAGLRIPMNEYSALQAEFTTGALSRASIDSFAQKSPLRERLNSYGLSWSKTIRPRLNLQLEVNYSTLKKSNDSTVQTLNKETNYFEYGKPLYNAKIGGNGKYYELNSWVGFRVSLFYNLRRNNE